jgi:hypothetical protein
MCIIEQSGMDLDNIRGGWMHEGTIWGKVEQNKSFIKNFYHPIERFRHTLDYVKMVEMHSQLVGYKVWNFSMTKWFQGECELEIDPRLQEMHRRMNFRHFYIDNNLIDLKDKTLPLTVSHKYSDSDDHPTPMMNWIWLRDYIAPEIRIMLDLSIEDQVKLDQDRVLKGDVN